MSWVENTSEIFREVRPLCVDIAQEPSVCKIDALRGYLQSHKSVDFSTLQEYIIFPLQLAIKRKNTTLDLKLRAFSCICTLLSETIVRRFDIFQDIFQNVCLLLSCKEPGKVRAMSEDVKVELVDCILTLLESSSQDVLEAMYTDHFMPSLGHCLSLMLYIAEHDKARHLVIKTMKCIRNFVYIPLQQENETTKFSQGQEKTLSKRLASFLPGISISLCKVATGGIKQGQNVIVQALDAWMSHIQVVMNDKYFLEVSPVDSVHKVIELMSKLAPQRANSEPQNIVQGKTSGGKDFLIQKDNNWFSNTASKLKVLFERLSSLAGHPAWKVRLALLQFCEVLLMNCSRSLETCVPCLVEIVIGLCSDDYAQVAIRSKTIMNELKLIVDDKDNSSFIQIIEEKLFTHFTHLPREIQSTEEEKKLHILRVIVGYLHLLGHNLPRVLTSGHILKKISQALVQVLEFDLKNIKIVEQKAPQTTRLRPLTDMHSGVAPESSSTKQPSSSICVYKKSFKHFRSDKVFDAVAQICYCLGRYGHVVFLVDHFLDLFRSSAAIRKQVAFLINEIIRGTIKNVDDGDTVREELSEERLDTLRSCMTLILTEYLAPRIWNARISNNEERLISHSVREDMFMFKERTAPMLQSVPFSELNSNIQLLCLLLEGISIFATVSQKHFESMLLTVLYPVMEKLGSSNATVSEMAYFSLITITASCDYSSVEELIRKNVDYLINSISLNLRHIRLHPDTPAVLNAMLQYGNKELIPYLQDTLEEVLSLIDYSSDEYLLSLVKVLNSVVVAINKWFPSEKPNEVSRNSGTRSQKQGTELKDFFIELLKLKKTSLGDISDEDFAADDEEANTAVFNEDDEKSDKKEIPQHIKFTERVLQKCTNFLASKFVKVRLVMLDTTEHGVLALKAEENHLLPMIHKLWQPLSQCFSDEELIVRIRAVSVLGTMVNTAGQFMRRRVISDVLPSLTCFLAKQQTVSLKAGPVYNHAQGFKLQLAILNTFGNLCRDLDISDVDLDRIASSMLPYLNQGQPSELQQAATDGLKILTDLDPELIWLSLNDLYCLDIPPPAGSTVVFPVVQFACVSSDKNDYTVNVRTLLDLYKR